ncbi:hypothetical protein OP861_09150 [Yersinia intermedia]|uniref:hypothetical protein n=1 Tax=Yersinia intermedia TaxID=631 RepID=UPI0022404B17|nr:hypothetical protein [Yersinia intermedia]UZM72787.1 hypothetical protein OP861_09150 [Yersinia intermedia]
MHQFHELAYRCTYFSLRVINEAYEKTVYELSETGSTTPVKNLQALNLQRMIHAVGLFSTFEAHLQQGLVCRNGFKEAELILRQAGEHALKEDFHNCYLAINALKHGDGASYKSLISNISKLNFVVESPTTPTFEEGDISGIFGLVRIDDNFIENCLELIEKVSKCIEAQRPDFIS